MIQSVGRAARILKALGSESARLGVTVRPAQVRIRLSGKPRRR